MKKEHTEKIAWIAKSKRVKFEKVDVEITWICKDKRRDKDNIMAGTKFILDGLVLASVIKNDGWSQIGNINHAFEVDKNNPRVEITLHEAKAADLGAADMIFPAEDTAGQRLKLLEKMCTDCCWKGEDNGNGF